MKRLTTPLFLLFLLACGSFAFAAATTKNYSGTYNGAACTVQVNWQDWKGLGPINGRVTLADGTTIPFSGSNSRPGVLDFEMAGKFFRLVRSDAGGRVAWVSKRLSFTEAATPTPTPTPKTTPSPTPTPPVLASAIVEEAYTGSWKGKAFTAKMRWAPGDVPEVVRRGRGTVTLEDGTQLSIEGWQRGAEASEFTLAPDETGETYKTTKATSDGKVVWESPSLTLTEKK